MSTVGKVAGLLIVFVLAWIVIRLLFGTMVLILKLGIAIVIALLVVGLVGKLLEGSKGKG